MLQACQRLARSDEGRRQMLWPFQCTENDADADADASNDIDTETYADAENENAEMVMIKGRWTL